MPIILSFPAVQLIKVRSEAMQVASEMYPGGMMTAYVAADSRLAFGCAVSYLFDILLDDTL